jgi:hypothetical protein
MTRNGLEDCRRTDLGFEHRDLDLGAAGCELRDPTLGHRLLPSLARTEAHPHLFGARDAHVVEVMAGHARHPPIGNKPNYRGLPDRRGADNNKEAWLMSCHDRRRSLPAVR